MRPLGRNDYVQRSAELIDLVLVSYTGSTLSLGYIPVWALYILAILSMLPIMK